MKRILFPLLLAAMTLPASAGDYPEQCAVVSSFGVEYYDLQGRRLRGPIDGFYLERRGGKVTKHVGR
ncbi:MAG: hypothetical protein LUC85_07340 [Bacteroidales bacterium]|nr:hypothetical protein [Bacteroidales bacterium]MCD8394634.1 hypothetical protein [Bacteroidales bacterium]